MVEPLRLFAQGLVSTDRVVLEATGNTLAIARILASHVDVVVLAHPKRLRANEAQAVLHRHLIERPNLTDIFGAAGRRWLAGGELEATELATDGRSSNRPASVWASGRPRSRTASSCT